MSSLFCIPAVAVLLLFTLWAVLSPRISFEQFSLPDYRKELEFAVFFLPGGLAGWLSILVAYSYLAEEANTFNLAWSLSLAVAFVILEFLGILALAQAGDSIEAARDAEAYDFIAMGVGYTAGVIIGTYDIIVHQPQPPLIVFSLGRGTVEIVLVIMGVILLASLDGYLLPYLRKRRKKAKRLTGTTPRTKKLSAPGPRTNIQSLPASEDLADGEDNPSGMQ